MALEISGISAIPSQEFQFLIEGGTITISLTYKAAIEMWFLDVLYDGNNFSVHSLRACENPNLLFPFSNLIPFGLMVNNNSDLGYEPSSLDDFSSRRTTLLILSEEEVEQVEDYYKETKEL
jgi:hypothetical protein